MSDQQDDNSPLGKQPPANMPAEAQSVWREAIDALDNIFERDITPQEFYYLLSRYPYLEICNADYPYIDEGVVPKITQAKNGWPIFDYGSVLCTGVTGLFAEELVGKKAKKAQAGEASDEDEGGEGTVVTQYTDAAYELIQMAIDNGWPAAEIISGFYPMQRMAWIASCEKGYTLKGFNAKIEDRVVLNWIYKKRDGSLYPSAGPKVVSMDPSGRRR